MYICTVFSVNGDVVLVKKIPDAEQTQHQIPVDRERTGLHSESSTSAGDLCFSICASKKNSNNKNSKKTEKQRIIS
jgi:hypothetical protein